jgi:hypothetical protein
MDRSGDAMDTVDAVEAARLLGYPRPGSLPKALLACADSTEPDANGSAGRLVWRLPRTGNPDDLVRKTEVACGPCASG